MVLEGNAIDRGLHRRIEQLHDQHQQHARDHQRPAGAAGRQEERRGNEDRRKQYLLPKRILVAERRGESVERVEKCVEDALQPGLPLVRTFHLAAVVFRST